MPLNMITRGAKSGTCNICGDVGPLTEDHTPPKGCVRPTAMELTHVTDRVGAEKAIKTKANDGVKYRTLCGRCNNAMLGGRYDPALIAFSNQVSALLASDLVLPRTVAVPTQPNLLARAVWGHMAAVGVDRYAPGPHAEALRDFFLDAALPMPSGMRVYYWVYPYRRQVLIRDAACVDVSVSVDMSGASATYWLMKFYPLAFAIWWPKQDFDLPYRYLDPRACASEDPVDVMLDLYAVPHELVLEAPTTSQALMFGKDSVVATNRPPRGQVLKL